MFLLMVTRLEISSEVLKGDRRSGKGREMEKAHCRSMTSNEIQNPNQNVTSGRKASLELMSRITAGLLRAWLLGKFSV